MDAPIQPPVRDKGMPQAVAVLKRELERRGIGLAYCADGASAVDYLLSSIPVGATVMNGGSTTLEQIGFLDALEDGPYDWLCPRVKAVSDPEERVRARRRATIADYFVGGINA
ncbi:MAG TPA: LUD domain-containing protein, partial [Burkholderiales bacterium]|nr:LUD domain-containing protein [Burkholderiales bacterium]